jgi:hypothetical protein
MSVDAEAFTVTATAIAGTVIPKFAVTAELLTEVAVIVTAMSAGGVPGGAV